MRTLRFSAWWSALGVMLLAIVLYLCLEPPDGTGLPLLNDKLAHFLSFFALSAWFAALVERRFYWQVVVAALAVGGLIEIAQHLMAYGRSAEWLDFAADAAGVMLGIAVSLVSRDSWFERIERWLVPT